MSEFSNSLQTKVNSSKILPYLCSQVFHHNFSTVPFPSFPPSSFPLLLPQVVEESSLRMQDRIPRPLPLEEIMEKYPVKYEESMNTVLVQEVRGTILH